MVYVRYLNGCIFDLHQARLQMLHDLPAPPLPGVDPSTDLCTHGILLRYLAIEAAWGQRSGNHFGLILLRVHDWPAIKQQYAAPVIKEIIISLACVLKTSLHAYDFPCRMQEYEFGAVLRDVNNVTMNVVVERLVTNFRVSAQRCLEGKLLPFECATAVYPFDAENVKDLLMHAESHWRVADDLAGKHRLTE
jgi:GGDEF domain-containing protein